jgi:hypothetical protein
MNKHTHVQIIDVKGNNKSMSIDIINLVPKLLITNVMKILTVTHTTKPIYVELNFIHRKEAQLQLFDIYYIA